MYTLLVTLLNKLDYLITGRAFSRPQNQVSLIMEKMLVANEDKFGVLLDIGGGTEPQYKDVLCKIAHKYINQEIRSGSGVNVVGSIYRIPFKSSSVDAVTLFMVLEHLNDPLRGLKECNRVLRKNGFILLTTVQYWHTHNHPHDYFRYTKQGLEYLCKGAGLKIVDIWSIGGPFLVVFHAIELNLPGMWRTIFSIFFYRLFDWLDWIVFQHEDSREHSDAVGWALIAMKI